MATPWGLRKPDTRPVSPLPVGRPHSTSIGPFLTDTSVYEVRHTINEALVLAHKESRPSVLEITTYRYRGHSVADPDQTYRSKEEIEEYKKSKDPINLFKDKLISEGHLNEEGAIEIDKRAKEEADASADFAQASPLPDPEELMEGVYWETDNPAEKTSGGTMFFETL